MKVLMVTPSFFPKIGGVEKHVLEVAKILENKVDLEILVISKNNKYQPNKFLTKTKISRWNSITFFQATSQILHMEVIDFLQTCYNRLRQQTGLVIMELQFLSITLSTFY